MLLCRTFLVPLLIFVEVWTFCSKQRTVMGGWKPCLHVVGFTQVRLEPEMDDLKQQQVDLKIGSE
jgi:predicted nucleic acid-binding Zn finger protein